MSNKYQLLHSQELVGEAQNPKKNINQLNYKTLSLNTVLFR